MTKIFATLALVLACASVSAPSFADESTITAPERGGDWGHMPPRDPDDRRPPFGDRIMCTARNLQGRTFTAMGFGRASLRSTQYRALQECRRESFFLGRTCRLVGCRTIGRH